MDYKLYEQMLLKCDEIILGSKHLNSEEDLFCTFRIINELLDDYCRRSDVYGKFIEIIPEEYKNIDFFSKIINYEPLFISILIDKFLGILTPELLSEALRNIPDLNHLGHKSYNFLYFCTLDWGIYGTIELEREDLITYDVVYEWCRHDGNALLVLSEDLIDEKICIRALKDKFNLHIGKTIPKKYRTESFYSKYTKDPLLVSDKFFFRYSSILKSMDFSISPINNDRVPFMFKIYNYYEGYTGMGHRFTNIDLIINNLLFMKN